MNQDKLIELAKEAGFFIDVTSEPMRIGVYHQKIDTELQRFAKLVRNEALEDAASVMEGSPVTINNVQHRETQHAGSWQVESTVGRFVSATAAKIRSLK